MRRPAANRALAALALLGSVSTAGAQDAVYITSTRLRLTTDPAFIRGCTLVGAVSDDSLKELRNKIVGAGGNTALLSLAPDDIAEIHAQVFRCTPPSLTPGIPGTPATPPIPASPLPPPPGPPPPGPPPPPPAR